MTEYLVNYNDRWHLAHAGAIQDFETDTKAIRLAWFGRDNAFICFDRDDPVVRKLPDLDRE